MINFSLQLKTKIHFGKNSIKELSNELKNYSKILLVYGGGSIKRNGIYQNVINELKKNNTEFFELSGIKPNPSLKSVYEGIKICKENNIEFVLGVGGGSVIDASKAIAVGVKHQEDIWDLFLDESKIKYALPVGTVLTLAATGSETNKNAVVTNDDTKEKLGIHHDCMKPQFAILDPSYTFSLPQNQTSSGIADIMAHVFEQYFSPTKESFLTDALSEAVLKTCLKYGPIALKDPENYEARAEIMWASTIALNGLLTCGKITDWLTHMMEHELSAYYDLNHGTGLAILFPNWMKEVANSNTYWKFRNYAVNVWHLDSNKSDEELCNESIHKTREFFNLMNLPSSLKEVNIDNKYFNDMVHNLVKRNKTGSFKQLGADEIMRIYQSSL